MYVVITKCEYWGVWGMLQHVNKTFYLVSMCKRNWRRTIGVKGYKHQVCKKVGSTRGVFKALVQRRFVSKDVTALRLGALRVQIVITKHKYRWGLGGTPQHVNENLYGN